jgi:hypothetical protein
MKTVEQLYEPYDFSATRCYVFTLEVGTKGYLKIEHKIPAYVRHLKGIFITAYVTNGKGQTNSFKQIPLVAGFITLNFNGQSLKCFQYGIPQTIYLVDCSKPLPYEELINRNSFVQGYFINSTTFLPTKYAYKLSIYLHYLP